MEEDDLAATLEDVACGESAFESLEELDEVSWRQMERLVGIPRSKSEGGITNTADAMGNVEAWSMSSMGRQCAATLKQVCVHMGGP